MLMNTIPDALIVELARYLGTKDIISLSKAKKKQHHALINGGSSESLWQQKYKELTLGYGKPSQNQTWKSYLWKLFSLIPVIKTLYPKMLLDAVGGPIVIADIPDISMSGSNFPIIFSDDISERLPTLMPGTKVARGMGIGSGDRSAFGIYPFISVIPFDKHRNELFPALYYFYYDNGDKMDHCAVKTTYPNPTFKGSRVKVNSYLRFDDTLQKNHDYLARLIKGEPCGTWEKHHTYEADNQPRVSDDGSSVVSLADQSDDQGKSKKRKMISP